MSLRTLPGHRIVTLMKRQHVRQSDVAEALKLSGSVVNKVIHREGKTLRPETIERVWKELERRITA